MAETVLVTGATGTLGRPTVTGLRAAGVDVRSLSRRPGPDLVTGDLLTGKGLEEALEGVRTVVNLATGPRRDRVRTRNLVDAARHAGVRHLVQVSIVGIDDVPLPYYKEKLAVEDVVTTSGIPYTLLRATQFHTLVVSLFAAQRLLPVLLAPSFSLQPISTQEVAARVVELTTGTPSGRVPDIGGPEVRALPELGRVWTRGAEIRRPVVPVRLPGRTFRAYAAGHALASGPAYGKVTFEEHLAAQGREVPTSPQG